MQSKTGYCNFARFFQLFNFKENEVVNNKCSWLYVWVALITALPSSSHFPSSLPLEEPEALDKLKEKMATDQLMTVFHSFSCLVITGLVFTATVASHVGFHIFFLYKNEILMKTDTAELVNWKKLKKPDTAETLLLTMSMTDLATLVSSVIIIIRLYYMYF